MRRLLIVCILGITFFTTGCNDTPFSPGETGFFPLNVGNTWIYESDSDRFGPPFENKVEIVGVSNIAGRSYFVFETIYHSTSTIPAYRDTCYYRSDGEGKIFGFREGEEFLYIDFNREVNEKWQSRGEYIGVIQGKNKIVEVPAGRFTNVTQVYFDIPQYVDDEFCENYAPGVGRLDISCLFGVPMYLKSARIDGKHYRAENLNPDRVIIIEDPLNFNPDSIEIDAFRIQFYSIYDDTLQLTVSHSGGCAQHDFKLYSTR
ncbi:MAG: hypothetical protein L0Y74_00235, partial [candidate division Zixibacteria bacterium]|nr:hypothetical protein [candidate division Zixibacteria bacterium]